MPRGACPTCHFKASSVASVASDGGHAGSALKGLPVDHISGEDLVGIHHIMKDVIMRSMCVIAFHRLITLLTPPLLGIDLPGNHVTEETGTLILHQRISKELVVKGIVRVLGDVETSLGSLK